MHERVARRPSRGSRPSRCASTHSATAARFASERRISAGRPPTRSAHASPSSASSTHSIDGVLMVEPSKIEPSSLPVLRQPEDLRQRPRRRVRLEPRDARGESASMPCAASPPSTFCQLQVTTSSLREVDRPSRTPPRWRRTARARRARAESSRAFGTRTPDVVPFQVKITSRSKSTAARSGSEPYGAESTRASRLELLGRVGRPLLAEALPGEHVDRPLAEQRPHRHLDRAGVGGRHDRRASSPPGMPSSARLRSITACSRSLAAFARCERPSSAPDSAASRPARTLRARAGRELGTLRTTAGLRVRWHGLVVGYPPGREQSTAGRAGFQRRESARVRRMDRLREHQRRPLDVADAPRRRRQRRAEHARGWRASGTPARRR